MSKPSAEEIYIKAYYIDDQVKLDFGRYGDGTTAIVLRPSGSGSGGPALAKATVALADGPLPGPGCVWLKGWGENAGIPEALIKAGVCRLTHRTAVTGFCIAVEAELLPPWDQRAKGGQR